MNDRQGKDPAWAFGRSLHETVLYRVHIDRFRYFRYVIAMLTRYFRYVIAMLTIADDCFAIKSLHEPNETLSFSSFVPLG